MISIFCTLKSDIFREVKIKDLISTGDDGIGENQNCSIFAEDNGLCPGRPFRTFHGVLLIFIEDNRPNSFGNLFFS